LCAHKEKAKRRIDTKVYKVFNEIGWDSIKIVLIEEHFLDNREQQLREEDRVITMYSHDPLCLNSYHSIDTRERRLQRNKEYKQRNKEKVQEGRKQYYINNKDKIDAYHKAEYTCDCGAILQFGNKPHHIRSKKHLAWLHDKQQTAETI